MQTLDFVSSLHNCLEFSQPLSCLYQATQTRKTFSIAKLERLTNLSSTAHTWDLSVNTFGKSHNKLAIVDTTAAPALFIVGQ